MEKIIRIRGIMSRKKGCVKCKFNTRENLDKCYKCLKDNNQFEKRKRDSIEID